MAFQDVAEKCKDDWENDNFKVIQGILHEKTPYGIVEVVENIPLVACLSPNIDALCEANPDLLIVHSMDDELGKRTLESSKELALLLKEKRELESEMNSSDYDDGEEESEEEKEDDKYEEEGQNYCEQCGENGIALVGSAWCRRCKDRSDDEEKSDDEKKETSDEKAEKSDDEKAENSDDEDEDKQLDYDVIKFVVITRSASTNRNEFAPFTISMDMIDPMHTIREKIVLYCHSSYDIAEDQLDKLFVAKLKIVDSNKRSMMFKQDDDNMKVEDFIEKHQLLEPYQIVMPLNFEGVGGGT